MYFKYLVGTKRLKYILTFLVGTIGFFLIIHNDLQPGFDRLGNDIGEYLMMN